MASTAYTRLRDQELAKSTKPFQAKGKSVKRCPQCQLAEYACLCPWRPKTKSEVEFVLLMHRLELFKPTNTGRLLADTFENCKAFMWQRQQPCEGLKTVLEDPARECFIVFPCEAKPDNSRKIVHALPPSNKTITLILLDGSWKQCSRMVALSKWLDDIPCLRLPETLVRSYLVRDSGRPDRFSTAEAAISCLTLAGEEQAAKVMTHYYNVFNQHYLATRGCYQPQPGESHVFLRTLRGE